MSNETKVKIDNQQVDKLEEVFSRTLRITMDALKTDIIQRQVTPKETGNLEGSAQIEDNGEGGYYLDYTTPYAERLYTHPEFNFRHDKNPHAQGKWLDYYIEGQGREWLQNAFITVLERELKKQ